MKEKPNAFQMAHEANLQNIGGNAKRQMTRWTITLFFTALLASTVATTAIGQCCCGHLYFRFYDKAENKLYPLKSDTSFTQKVTDTTSSRWAYVHDTVLYGDFKLRITAFKGYMGGSQEITMFRDYHQGLMFQSPIGCGVEVLGISVMKGNKRMVVNFVNVEEADFVIDSIPFIEDTITYNVLEIQKLRKAIINNLSPYRWASGFIIPSDIYSSQKQTDIQPQTVAAKKDSCESTFLNGKHRHTICYYPNGQKKLESFYDKSGSPTKTLEWYDNGNKLSKITFIRNNKYRKTISWDNNGKREKDITKITYLHEK